MGKVDCLFVYLSKKNATQLLEEKLNWLLLLANFLSTPGMHEVTEVKVASPQGDKK